MSNYHMSNCQRCGKYDYKKNMRPIYTGTTSGTPKIICFLCESCFLMFLEEYEVSM